MSIVKLLADAYDRPTELKLWLRRDLRLLIERREGGLPLDLREVRRSGTITTGIDPVFHTSLRAFRLEIEVVEK